MIEGRKDERGVRAECDLDKSGGTVFLQHLPCLVLQSCVHLFFLRGGGLIDTSMCQPTGSVSQQTGSNPVTAAKESSGGNLRS